MIVKSPDRNSREAEVKEIFRRTGIVPTQQRLQIACVMLSCAQHLSAEQLLMLVNQEGGNVSKATVYNTLGLFARKGLVREVLVDPDRVFFDSNTDAHYHLYNEDNGELTDFYGDGVLSSVLPELPRGKALIGVDVIVRIRDES
jgi:Fur family iron response transcriptional regulator